ncbi:MAG: family 5 extracellular solute-binding protein peptide/nickel transport system substrate-binding [Parcubacteria group bacterium]|nr:family 5 extracellular solute-binding protein peptide/nickel transport system substrate-binding [Parcubacteria group bacterium]
MTYSSLRTLLVKRFDLPKERSVNKAVRSFTIAEKTVFYFFVGLFVLSGLSLVYQINSAYLVEVPLQGGSLSEGVVGNPRFINPVLAYSEADKNLSALIYSGLVRLAPDGSIVNDIADDVSISPDGLTYTVHIRPDATFQDNEPITSDDVEFTIQKIENTALKSPLFGTWAGIGVEKPDASTVVFTLKKPYAPFIDNLTLGILPKHIWKNVTDDEFSFSQFNALPIGSGPYTINAVQRNSGGIPDYYDLSPFERSIGGMPWIKHLIFKFYPNQTELLNAYQNGDIESISGFSPEEAIVLLNSNSRILSSPLPRVFGVFFNQSQNKALLDKSARQALDLSAPKEKIVEDILHGYATVIDGPLPPALFAWSGARSTTTPIDARMAAAQQILIGGGWTKNPQTGIFEKKSKGATLTLSFSISTGDAPELKAVAEKLRTAWQTLGAKVDVLVFETGDLNQNVIRPRKFEALLFGEVVGRDADVYPFWHSSERNDPGLNIALYANSKVDKLLEDARQTTDPIKRENDYRSFDKEIRADVPAVFLYTPSYLYLAPTSVKSITFGELTTPQDRFLGIRDWYIETTRVWKLFVR